VELRACVQDFLDTHRVSADAQTILDLLERRIPHCEIPGDSGSVHLIQLYHPVVMRKEIFLGNVLFNAYLGLTMQRVLRQEADTHVLPVIHDLESYYLLVHTTLSIGEIRSRIRQGWIDGMEDLYFSDPEQEEAEQAAHQGYYGRFRNMLQNYYKSNIQPFPLMVVPFAYARKLEQRIRAYLLDKLSSGEWSKEIANFTANFSFFYGQTSGGTGDVQSCPNFLRRLVAEYQVVSPDDMISAFQLPKNTDFSDPATKNHIQEKLFKKGDTPAYYKEKLQQVFEQALHHFGESIEKHAQEGGEPSEWLFRYHREKGVFLDLSPEELLDELIIGATVGGQTISQARETCSDETCIMCGYREARLTGATIISTDSFSKFHNHTINRGSNEKRICYNCALYAYLTIKLSGSKSGGMGQIPRIGNLVFHYGDYTDGEIRQLVERFQEQVGYITKSADEVKALYDEDFELLFGDDEESANNNAKILRSLFLRNDNGEVRLFPIHFGERRLVLFVLPGLHEDIQKRVSFSRYSTMNVLSWLHRVSQDLDQEEDRVKGNFYYLTLPKLEHALHETSKLYIKDKVYDADQQIQLHEYYKKVVPALSSSRAKGGYEHQIIVAERVQRDPLGVFSHEMRGWLGDGKVSLGRQEQFYDMYTKLREIERMEKEGVDVIREVEGLTREEVREILDAFTDRLFYTLDMLNLLPKSLSDRPHSFEKWARKLISPLKRSGAALEDELDKWENSVMRQHSFHLVKEENRHKRLDVLKEFRTFCEGQKNGVPHQTVIKAHANHLLTSLLAKAVAYLYPVTELARAYTRQHVGQQEYFEKDVILKRFQADVQNRCEELKEKKHLTEQHLQWAQEHMVMFREYYAKFKNKEDGAGGEAV
jgi:hypothetical protein